MAGDLTVEWWTLRLALSLRGRTARMKTAPADWHKWIGWITPNWVQRLIATLVQPRNRTQQALGIMMTGAVVQIGCRTSLDNPPTVHNVHTLCITSHNPQIMRNKYKRRTVIGADFCH
jgi:hypothetical protein